MGHPISISLDSKEAEQCGPLGKLYRLFWNALPLQCDCSFIDFFYLF